MFRGKVMLKSRLLSQQAVNTFSKDDNVCIYSPLVPAHPYTGKPVTFLQQFQNYRFINDDCPGSFYLLYNPAVKFGPEYRKGIVRFDPEIFASVINP